MRRRPWLVIGLALPLLAAEGPDTTAAPAPQPTPPASGGGDTPWVSSQTNEIVVWGDLFARWDDTRWRIDTEIEIPFPVLLAKENNLQFFTTAYQVRTVIACSKTWKLGKKHFEVDCVLEDVALQATIAQRYSERAIKNAGVVLDELDAMLTGVDLQLQVADDGRVTNISLEGLQKDNDREQMIHETLRQVLSRVVVGFDMKLQKMNQLNEGKWIEYHSALMSMPLPSGSTATRASSTLIHYLNRYKGHILVQSIGKGMIEAPALGGQRLDNSAGMVAASQQAPSAAAQPSGISAGGSGSTPDDGDDSASNGFSYPGYTYDTDLIGVSIFDQDEGFMTERVWALEGKPTASAGLNTRRYWHAGRITMLGETEKPDLGPTAVVSPRGAGVPGVIPWQSIEQDVK